jgi:hypothetical protein
MRCEACQGEINANDKFCSQCGARVGIPVEGSAPESAPLGTSDDISAETIAKNIEELVHQTYGHGTDKDSLSGEEAASEGGAKIATEAPITFPLESEMSRLVQNISHDTHHRSGSPQNDLAEQLTKLAKLHKVGALSAEEFTALKAKFIADADKPSADPSESFSPNTQDDKSEVDASFVNRTIVSDRKGWFRRHPLAAWGLLAIVVVLLAIASPALNMVHEYMPSFVEEEGGPDPGTGSLGRCNSPWMAAKLKEVLARIMQRSWRMWRKSLI